MNGNCHFLFGAVTGAALAVNMDSISEYLPSITNTPETVALFVLGGLVGGILPDIDNPYSYIGKLTVPVSTGIVMVGDKFGKSGYNHRWILHDPLPYLACLYLSYLYFPPLIGLFIGCLSHLYLDMFNPSGISWMLGVKHLHLGKIYSGSKESVIFTVVSAVIVLLLSLIIKFELI
jgi:inner membrane protein